MGRLDSRVGVMEVAKHNNDHLGEEGSGDELKLYSGDGKRVEIRELVEQHNDFNLL